MEIAGEENVPKCKFKYHSLNENDLSITLIKRKKAKIHFNSPSELTTVQNSINNSPVFTGNTVELNNPLLVSPKNSTNQNLLFNKANKSNLTDSVACDSKNLLLQNISNQQKFSSS